MILPEDAKLEGINATYANGVLTVHVPREKGAAAANSAAKINVQ